MAAGASSVASAAASITRCTASGTALPSRLGAPVAADAAAAAMSLLGPECQGTPRSQPAGERQCLR